MLQKSAMRDEIAKMTCSVLTTPCPVPTSFDQLFNTNLDETTTNLDFTTESRASLRAAKPKRPYKHSVQFTIHEDTNGEEPCRDVTRTQLLRPPRRIQNAQQARDAEAHQEIPVINARDQSASRKSLLGSMSRLGQAPKRLKSRLSTLPENTTKDASIELLTPATEVSRPARRGTLYIPNEDTTMPSMYMGVFSPIKDLDFELRNAQSPEEQVEVTGIAAQMAMKRAGRTSITQSEPRRGILRSSSRKLQQTATNEDRYGSGGGKENVPPNAQAKDEIALFSTRGARRIISHTSELSTSDKEKAHIIPLHASTTSSLSKCQPTGSAYAKQSSSKPAWNAGSGFRQPRQISTVQALSQPITTSSVIRPIAPEPKVPTRFVLPVIAVDTATQKYPILAEDVMNPAMYEDNWLYHQEIVVTQLVNDLFSATRNFGNSGSQVKRDCLLQAYCSAPMIMLHKRLKAALLYGTLSIPQETLETGARLHTDLGLRKRFVDLWLHTYHPNALVPALEVVVGRDCSSAIQFKGQSGQKTASRTTPHKAAIRNFIEAFLIRNEDAKPDSDSVSRIAWSYQRTVLRSLLLIKVLDLVKSDTTLDNKECLFQTSSSFKSSVSIVKALMQQLNPAAGDSIRALSHIDYVVTHTQCPLDEYDYRIENLAVDLRDGIRLTRLIELLLYPSASLALEKTFDEGTTTLLLPEGETLDFENGQDWPLSQHLKTTNQSRAVRLWNVQLALTALRNVKSVASMVEGINAEDIVDGFREKTIKLLWALVGKWGLAGLVDWQDLKWEIRRLENSTNRSYPDEQIDEELDEEDLSFQVCKGLLRRWSRAVASSRGVIVRNFTTGFADGAIFKAIVDEYEQYIQPDAISSERKLCLEERLTRLGCSTQFSQLFAEPKQTHIFDRDFVLAALAFLCSRLLAPSQRSRAVTVIQKAWRSHRTKIEELRKQEKRRIASACAEMVKSKQNTLNSGKMTDPGIGKKSSPPTILDKKSEDVCNPIMSPNEDIWLDLSLA